jgi:hypothetical protein
MPGQEEAMTRNHIIVGLDDSPSGRAALRWAAHHALLAGSVLRAIHVLDWPYSSATPSVDITPATMDELESAYRTNITNVFQDRPTSGLVDGISERRAWTCLGTGVETCATTCHRNSGACRARPIAGRFDQPLLPEPRKLPCRRCSRRSIQYPCPGF